MIRAERDEILAAWDAAVAAHRVGWNTVAESLLLALFTFHLVQLSPPNVIAYGGRS